MPATSRNGSALHHATGTSAAPCASPDRPVSLPAEATQPPPSHATSDIPLERFRGDPHPTLPPLCDSDDRLLETYLKLNSNLDLLADHSKVPLLHLLRWLNQPHIQQYLQALDSAHARQSAAADQSDRRAAIDALRQVLTDSNDPTEKRRAATAILRALSPRPQRAPSDHTSSNPQSEIPNPQPPRPRSRPSASLNPHELVSAALRALRDNDSPDDNSGLATLHAHCAPGAMINGEPVEPEVSDFIENLDDHAREVLTEHIAATPQGVDESPTQALVTFTLSDASTWTVVKFLLRREKPDLPFLIHSIDFPAINSS